MSQIIIDEYGQENIIHSGSPFLCSYCGCGSDLHGLDGIEMESVFDGVRK